ncbi:AAEL005905-PA [Aedes aegypti]|uniref:AAEL005905-PA n=2 Tax=Aedes aegypti TaxID=7159 RepID=A0A1S4FBY7_AEDAE|nr:DALR anticodon-binding domain-containing protein 3 [Aedes aegypti]EAT42580.1 AAEL005905-PA [Aedes aegypti]
MHDMEKFEEHLKKALQKWFNISRYSIRYQSKQLAQCGDIVVKFIPPTPTDVSFETQSLIEESIEWNLPLETIEITNLSAELHLKRESVFRYFITNCIEDNLRFHNEELNYIVLISDTDELCPDNFTMTDFRLSVVHEVVKNVLGFCGFKVLNHRPTEEVPQVINIARNRRKGSTGIELLCGPVTSNGIIAADYIKKRANDMQLIAQHKYGIRVRDHQRFQETIASLGRSAAIVDMLESKTSSPIDMRKEKNQSSKGAAFILYNYARISVLFKTFAEKQKTGYYPELPPLENVDYSLLSEEDEWHLFWVYVVGFPEMLKQALGDGQLTRLSPHLVLGFTSGLVICLSKYYRRVRILTENRDHLLPTMYARIYLLKSVYYILSTLLDILDLEAVTQM